MTYNLRSPGNLELYFSVSDIRAWWMSSLDGAVRSCMAAFKWVRVSESPETSGKSKSATDDCCRWRASGARFAKGHAISESNECLQR